MAKSILNAYTILSKGSALTVANKNIMNEAKANILIQKSVVCLYMKRKKFFSFGGRT